MSKSGRMKARYSISLASPASGQMRISNSGICSVKLSRHACAVPICLSRLSMSSATIPLRNNLRAHVAFELLFAESDCLVDRFALLRALGNHLAHCSLRVHLHADPRRRGMAGDGHDNLAARREIVER